ncbi:MAG: choice-of-anchor J domain-containing protein [Ignavibacteria bacterium]
MKKIFSTVLVVVVALGLTLGFIMDDPFGSKSPSSTTKQTGSNPVHVSYGTPVYTDNFDGANDTTALRTRGYKIYQNSVPLGITFWFQGNETVFPAYNGPTTGYVGANFNATSGAGQIDVWMITPKVTGGGIQAGDSLYFYSRTSTGSTWPDSIRVMYSTSDSTVSGTWTELGRFLVSAAGTWEKRGFRAPTASANGRFAIRYTVANGGPSGSNSNYIGIDALTIERSGTPPPTAAWTEQVSGITTTLYSVSAVNDDIAWACGASGKVLRTTNKGATWTNVSGNLPTSAPLYNIFAWDANVALATASPTAGNYIYRTSNGGANWTEVNFQAGGFGNGLWMTDANTAYHVGDPVGGNWTFLKSTNGGVNWTTWATVPTTQAGWNNALMIVGNNVWMGTNANYFMYSSNLGANWSQQTTTFTNQYSVWFNSETVGLAGYNALNLTTNGGTNWSALASPVATNTAGIAGTGTEWWVATQNTTVHYSSNNGAVWSTAYTAPDGLFYHLTKARTGNTIWAVRNNGKISRYGTPISGITVVSNEIPSSYSVSQNYPNPFNPTTKINFALPKSGLVTMKVYDILGKEVATLVNEVKNAGSYTVDFNASSLTSGMYFYKVSVNGFSEVKKMMLIK